jgi:hypothetical protein
MYAVAYDITSSIDRSAVTIGDGSQLYSTPKGSIRVTDSIKVDNALYVPGLACNLLSVRELLSGPFRTEGLARRV